MKYPERISFENTYLNETGTSSLEQFIEAYETFEEIPLAPFDENFCAINAAGFQVNQFLMELAAKHLSKIWDYAKERLSDSEYSEFCAILSFVIDEDDDFPGNIRPNFYVTRRKRWMFQHLQLVKDAIPQITYFQELLRDLGLSGDYGVYRSPDVSGWFRIYIIRLEEIESLL